MPAEANVKALLAANWKMNPVDGGEAVDLVRGVLPVAQASADNVEVALFPPFRQVAGERKPLSYRLCEQRLSTPPLMQRAAGEDRRPAGAT